MELKGYDQSSVYTMIQAESWFELSHFVIEGTMLFMRQFAGRHLHHEALEEFMETLTLTESTWMRRAMWADCFWEFGKFCVFVIASFAIGPKARGWFLAIDVVIKFVAFVACIKEIIKVFKAQCCRSQETLEEMEMTERPAAV